MRVIVAPDSFGETLTAVEAAESISAGWRRGRPEDDVVTAPQSDGGPGFVDVLATAGGDIRTARGVRAFDRRRRRHVAVRFGHGVHRVRRGRRARPARRSADAGHRTRRAQSRCGRADCCRARGRREDGCRRTRWELLHRRGTWTGGGAGRPAGCNGGYGRHSVGRRHRRRTRTSRRARCGSGVRPAKGRRRRSRRSPRSEQREMGRTVGVRHRKTSVEFSGCRRRGWYRCRALCARCTAAIRGADVVADRTGQAALLASADW